MLAVPLKSVAGARTLAYLTDNREMGGKPSMEFAHELIVVILNEGYSDFVMDAARSAGAGGGTVLHAKGTAGAARRASSASVWLMRRTWSTSWPTPTRRPTSCAPFRSRPGRHEGRGDLLLAADLGGCGTARTGGGIRRLAAGDRAQP